MRLVFLSSSEDSSFPCKIFDHPTFSVELRAHDLHEAFRNLGIHCLKKLILVLPNTATPSKLCIEFAWLLWLVEDESCIAELRSPILRD